MIPTCCLFRSSSYHFRDKPFFCQNVRICIFFKVTCPKIKFSTKYIFFIQWSQNCVCFALALSLTVSEISPEIRAKQTKFWDHQKTKNRHFFQGHMTKNIKIFCQIHFFLWWSIFFFSSALALTIHIFCQIRFFPLLIKRLGLFRSSSYRFRD